MADGRRNNGGVRPNSGRKSKAEELGMAQLLDASLPAGAFERIAKNLFKLATGANPKAAVAAGSLLLAYRFGKPTEKHEHGGEGGGPITVRVVYETK
jgi:hypothetical protein